MGLSQIYPVWDEDTSEERVAVSASFIDPYLVVIRDDASVLLLQADESGDLDEVSLPHEISTSQWRSACLYHDQHQVFDTASGGSARNKVLLFLLDSKCNLSVGCRHKII